MTARVAHSFAPLSYDDAPLKDNSQVQMYARPLLEAGYTVFAIDHRFPPRFRHPAAVEDAQRAVRQAAAPVRDKTSPASGT
jgi:hypothetical protein